MKPAGAYVGACVAALVTVVGTGPAAGAESFGASWTLDEIAGSTAYDSSGNGNNGTNYNVVGNGSGYIFNGTNSRVVVPDSPSLDPGTADFSFGATLVMTVAPAVGETYDVLRKGLTTTAGGDYKLEIVRTSAGALARCVVKDANKVVASVRASTNLADGQPHAVTCRRVGSSVVVQVDSRTPVTKRVAVLGSVSNANKLGLGAKAEGTATTGFDWYPGEMLEAFVRVG